MSTLVEYYKKTLPKNLSVLSVLGPENRQAESLEILKILGLSASVSANPRLKGGLILIGSDFEFDLSVEKLFAEIRSNSEIEITKSLFQK